ncbi:MAG: hypothetical protein IID51_08085 [Proteobacteria bacterium]|nr:hypothetical protein [Pseudomonadota bacterium]
MSFRTLKIVSVAAFLGLTSSFVAATKPHTASAEGLDILHLRCGIMPTVKISMKDLKNAPKAADGSTDYSALDAKVEKEALEKFEKSWSFELRIADSKDAQLLLRDGKEYQLGGMDTSEGKAFVVLKPRNSNFGQFDLNIEELSVVHTVSGVKTMLGGDAKLVEHFACIKINE